ncbi:DUF1643 domain-containing protein [Agrococcus terreus]|uniref:DUF1643 domain-containing protein n=1 Tax=Agrococcus terreus TaxID=574649 RepID=UPI0038510DF3
MNGQQPWIYQRSADGSARFVLGTVGENPLVCFGINPSTAVPGAPDPTVRRLMGFAARDGFDSWVMLNVHPQISTDPRGLDHVFRPDFKTENERHIARVIDGRPLTLLAAWGGLIESRPYLRPLLKDIVQLADAAGYEWVSLGDPIAGGHPRHPSRARGDAPLQRFDVTAYLRASDRRASPRY